MVLAGLDLAPVIEASLRAAGWPVPARPADAHGGVDPELRQEVLTMARAVMGGGTPLSEHRSCAVNRFRGLPCKVAHKELGTRSSERGAEPLSRLESDEWLSLNGEAPLRITACSCFGDIRDEITTHACIGDCRFDAGPEPLKVNACQACILDVEDRPRDRAGYCLLRAA